MAVEMAKKMRAIAPPVYNKKRLFEQPLPSLTQSQPSVSRAPVVTTDIRESLGTMTQSIEQEPQSNGETSQTIFGAETVDSFGSVEIVEPDDLHTSLERKLVLKTTQNEESGTLVQMENISVNPETDAQYTQQFQMSSAKKEGNDEFPIGAPDPDTKAVDPLAIKTENEAAYSLFELNDDELDRALNDIPDDVYEQFDDDVWIQKLDRDQIPKPQKYYTKANDLLSGNLLFRVQVRKSNFESTFIFMQMK